MGVWCNEMGFGDCAVDELLNPFQRVLSEPQDPLRQLRQLGYHLYRKFMFATSRTMDRIFNRLSGK